MSTLNKILSCKYTLTLFIVLVALWFVLWLFSVPTPPLSPLGGPDEGLRYLVPKFIFENGSLPTGYDSATIHTMGNWSYAFYPQFLGPIVSATFMSISALFYDTADSLLYAARLSSVMFGVLTVFFVGMSVRKIFGNDKNRLIYSYTAMGLVAAWPQVAFLSSYVNNDIVALSGVAIIFYACVAGMKDRWNVVNTITLSVGFVICLLGYINSYGFVLFGGLFFLITLYWQSNNLKYNFKLLSIVFAAVILLAGPFFVRNAIIYNGDVFGINSFRAETLEWERSQKMEAQKSYHELTNKGFFDLVRDEGYRKTQLNSSIARFGKMTIAPVDKYMMVYKAVLMIGIIGFIWMVANILFSYSYKLPRLKVLLKKYRQEFLFTLGVTLASVVTVSLSLYYSYAIDNQAQGRYVIYLLIPLIIASVLGITHSINKVIVERYRITILLALLTCYLMTTLIVFYKYVYITNLVR